MMINPKLMQAISTERSMTERDTGADARAFTRQVNAFAKTPTVEGLTTVIRECADDSEKLSKTLAAVMLLGVRAGRRLAPEDALLLAEPEHKQ